MILASFDFEITEPELRSLCECDETGTYRSKALKAITELGFNCNEAFLSIEELNGYILQELNPIVFLRFHPQANYDHAVVVYKISRDKVFVLDPEMEECEIDIKLFTEVWKRGLSIIIENGT